MTHAEVRNKLRNQYQGKLCWQYSVGDHDDEHTPKNVLSCWAVAGPPVKGHSIAHVIFVFEMSDHHGKEQGFEILNAIDNSNELQAEWDALDKLVGKTG